MIHKQPYCINIAGDSVPEAVRGELFRRAAGLDEHADGRESAGDDDGFTPAKPRARGKQTQVPGKAPFINLSFR